jgi:hypothetical protein
LLAPGRKNPAANAGAAAAAGAGTAQEEKLRALELILNDTDHSFSTCPDVTHDVWRANRYIVSIHAYCIIFRHCCKCIVVNCIERFTCALHSLDGLLCDHLDHSPEEAYLALSRLSSVQNNAMATATLLPDGELACRHR